jgi:hypothetical protein
MLNPPEKYSSHFQTFPTIKSIVLEYWQCGANVEVDGHM